MAMSFSDVNLICGCFRYKMPRMLTRKEGHGNGVKTNITNLIDIANALRVPDSSMLKWFCKELGASSEGTTIIKGIHSVQDLCHHLDR